MGWGAIEICPKKEKKEKAEKRLDGGIFHIQSNQNGLGTYPLSHFLLFLSFFKRFQSVPWSHSRWQCFSLGFQIRHIPLK